MVARDLERMGKLTPELREKYDPLGLLEIIREDPRVDSIEEFDLMSRAGFASHDNGNMEVNERTGVPEYRARSGTRTRDDGEYLEIEAEDRSIVALNSVIDESAINRKDDYKSVGGELIGETRFLQPVQGPYGTYAKLMDQIGSAYLRDPLEEDEAVFGLMREMLMENPNAIINPDLFVNFRQKQIGNILGKGTDETREFRRKFLKNIWGVEEPPEVGGLYAKGVSAENLVRAVEEVKRREPHMSYVQVIASLYPEDFDPVANPELA
jgi:hypothetical protein